MRNALRTQALPALTLLAFLVGVVVVLQLWLLGASLEGILGGRANVAAPAALASFVLFLISLGLLTYVRRIDRHARTDSSTLHVRSERNGAGP